jgi:hypothetical protein
LTAVLEVPDTVAVNCCVALVCTDAEVGEMLTATGLMVTAAEADFVVSACEVAVTVAVVWFATLAGAVYKPEVDTVPGPVSDQVTAVLVVPVTVAVNCCVPPPFNVAEVGEIETLTGGRPLE